MSDITASGYCITYGSCEYHETVLPNALIDDDGREVPVRYYANKVIGNARLTHTDKGIIADVKLVPTVCDLAINESDELLKFGCMVNNLKKNNHNEVVHGTIAYVDVSPSCLGDVVTFKKEE